MGDVLGTIDTAITWAHKAVQVVKGIASARHDVAVLIKDLDDSLMILNETKSLFSSVEKQKQKPEGQKRWLDELIKTTCKEFREALERLDTAFQVNTNHGQFHSFVDRTWKGAKWYMKKSEIEDWISKIEKQNGAIKSMVQILDAMNGQDIMMSQKYIQDAMNRDRFLHIIEKLPTQDENPVEILERISQSLPEWVLGDVDYKKWMNERSPDNNWLWMLGAAGSGKSHIATYVFDQLWRSSAQEKDLSPSAHGSITFQEDGHDLKEDEMLEPDDDHDGLHTDKIRPTGSASAIYYCNDIMNDSQTSNYIFRTIVSQLVQQLWVAAPQSAYAHVASLSALCGGDTASPDAKPAHSVLVDIVKCLARAHIVIDALDELPTAAFRDLMPKLQELGQECPHLRIFTTSRDGMRVDAGNNGAIKMESSRNASTLRSFVWIQLASVQAEIDSANHDADGSDKSSYGESALPKLVQSEEGLEFVGGKIVEVADGNFLAAELLIQRLLNEKEEASLHAAIGNLSGALGDLIAEAVERIEKQRSPSLAAIGRHTLLWVSHAPKGSMRVDELQYALALSLYGNPAKWQDFSSKDLLEATGYFVSIEAASVSVHKAVRDFCLDPCKGAAYFPDAHGIMAKACLACLDACIAPCRDYREWDEAKQANPFLGYAAANWGWHLALAEEAMPVTPFRRLQLMRILEKDKALDAVTMAIQPCLRRLGIWHDTTMGPMLRSRKSPRPISVVHMLALFNLPLTAREWLVHSREDADGLQHILAHSSGDSAPEDYCSALYLASVLGHDAVVQVLMEAGANPLRLNGLYRATALAEAIRNNFVRTVVTLLALDSAEAVVRQRAPRVPRILPLALACGSTNRRGSARIVREILAVMEEMDDYTEMLLDRAGPKGLTALHRAAEGGNPDVITALLDAPGGDALLELSSSKINQETPLITAGWASWKEGNAAVPCLVGRGADVTARNKLGDTPLHAIARHEGHIRLNKTECFESLLPRVLDLSVQNHQGQTVLHLACHEGRSAHVAVLLAPDYLEKTRAAFQIADSNGRTAIMVAAHARGGPMSKAHVHCIRLLIPHAARDMSISNAAALYSTLLQQDKPKAVEMLLDHVPGLEDHVTRHGTSTILHQAIEAGHLRMVELAIRRGGKRDLETPNAAGENPLWEAQRRMNADVASYLLEQGAAVGSNMPGAALRLCVNLSDEALTRALWRREPALLRPRENTDDRADAVRRMSVRNAVYRLWRDHDILQAPQIPVHEVLCLNARRDEEVDVSRPMKCEAGVYLETEPLGHDVKIPLSRLEITIIAQDQGWSDWQDQHPHHKGTFHGSDTWFEIALKRDGTLVRQLECTRNLLNVGDWTTYRVVWDSELGLGELQEAPGSQVSDGMQIGYARPGCLRRGDAERFVAMIRGGDRVLVLPRSKGAGWVCRVKSVEVNGWFEEDGNLC